jgi:hypothetical protein
MLRTLRVGLVQRDRAGAKRAWYETLLQFTETGQETPHCSAGNDMLEIMPKQLSPAT